MTAMARTLAPHVSSEHGKRLMGAEPLVFHCNYYNYFLQKTLLLDEELAETDTAARDELIGQLQDIVAEDVPLIPSWNGKNVAVASKQMEGVADTLDPTYIFRFWEISKSN